MGRKLKGEIKNVFFISIDTLRSDCISANSNRDLLDKYQLKNMPRTDCLDRFVEGGVFFPNCISSAPYTPTSHASILTGKWPKNHGVKHFKTEKIKDVTILEVLRRSGFQTFYGTDFPFIGQKFGFSKGSEAYAERDSHEKKLLSFLKKNRKKPVAGFIHFSDVHIPYGYHGYSTKQCVKKTIDLADKYGSFPERLLRDKKGLAKHILKSNAPKFIGTEKNAYFAILQGIFKKKRYGEIMDLYVEGINRFDRGRFNTLVSFLEKEGFLKNSLFVIFSDHGEMWAEKAWGHGMKGNTVNNTNIMSDEVLKVPLIFSGPMIPKGRIIETQVRTIDIFPTVLGILGIKNIPRNLDGKTIKISKGKVKEEVAFSQSWRSNGLRRHGKKNPLPSMASVRLNGHKVIQWYDGKGGILKEEFFELRKLQRKIIAPSMTHREMSKKLKSFNFQKD